MARFADYMILVFLILLLLREVLALEMVIPVWLNVGVCIGKWGGIHDQAGFS
jgi:hypothetical protein